MFASSNFGRLLEAAFEILGGALDRPLIEPRQHPEHEHVAASEHRAIVQPQPMHAERGQLGHVNLDHLEFVERMVAERIRVVAGALEIGVGERLAVHDDDGVGRGRRRGSPCSAAGFIATSTLGSSPAVKISLLEKLSWKPLTPARVPAGARISAGKSGSVAISFPASADSAVNCMPVNCIPSPESPANRITTGRASDAACARTRRNHATRQLAQPPQVVQPSQSNLLE